MSQPNLIFLMTDQQRADTVETGSLCQTPYLDSLAAAGTQFRRCYTANPICSPSRASLMTGLLPHTHGMVDCTHTVPSYRAALQSDLPFWSQTLQASGYRTGYFGKWHLERSNRLENFGFETYHLTSPFVDGYHKQHSEEYRAYRRSLGLESDQPVLSTARIVKQKGYRDLTLYGITDEPVEATREYFVYSQGINFLHQVTKEPQQPFLLFLSTEAPHDPYIAVQEYYNRYDPDNIQKPSSFDDDLMDRPAIYRRLKSVWHELEWQQFAEATACYYASCSMIDDQIGRLLSTLDELGQRDNTIIVFCSDHGDFMGAHRLLTKGIPPFEEAYRVPLIMSGPGIPTNRQIHKITSLLDLAPTLVALIDNGEFSGHGRSLMPLIRSDDSEWESEAYAEMHGQRFAYTQRLLWRDRYKYVFNTIGEDEFYDLKADPLELRNLAQELHYQEIIETMAARMWEIMHETDDFNMLNAQDPMYRYAPVGPDRPKQWRKA
jgi:arylsulfatase A-like enzyme